MNPSPRVTMKRVRSVYREHRRLTAEENVHLIACYQVMDNQSLQAEFPDISLKSLIGRVHRLRMTHPKWRNVKKAKYHRPRKHRKTAVESHHERMLQKYA